MTAERREYRTLNGLRGVAAICVVLFHGDALVGQVFPRGYLAVDLFFVLSGFVIAHAYEGRLRAGLGVGGFTLVRLIRFWPLYALGLALGVARDLLLVATGNDYALPVPTLLAAAAMGVAFLPLPLATRGDNLFPLNVPSWSLFFELLVNILYAAVRQWLSLAVLLVAIAASGIALVLLTPATGIGHVGVEANSFGAGCARTIFSFGLGVLIYRLRPNVPALPAPLLLALAAAGLAWPWGGRSYDLAFVVLLSPVLVMMGTGAEPAGRAGSLADWLGLVSFPLYAIHRPLMHVVEALANRLPLPPMLLGWIAVAGLLVLATIANRLDVVVRRRLDAWLRPPLRRDPARSAAP